MSLISDESYFFLINALKKNLIARLVIHFNDKYSKIYVELRKK